MNVCDVELGVEVTADFVDSEQSEPRLDPALAPREASSCDAGK